jgi:hypothetical protein
MVGGPVGLLANPMTRLLGLGLVMACACIDASPSAEAGCSFQSGSHSHSLDGPKRSGELSLKLYVQYSAGGFSYSFYPPTPPCSGPHCGATPRMKPVGTSSWFFRLNGTFATDSTEKPPRINNNRERTDDHPRSVFAPRGSIAAQEHPPKPA